MELQQHMHQHLHAKLIYQHAIGMEIQDVQVEDAPHISDSKQPVQLLLQQGKHVGNHLQSL